MTLQMGARKADKQSVAGGRRRHHESRDSALVGRIAVLDETDAALGSPSEVG